MSQRYADHDWFQFRPQSFQPALDLGSGIAVGVHLIIHVQAFHIDAKPATMSPGLLDRPYPDVTNWSQRKVGLRDGLARICSYLDANDMSASFVVEADAIPELDAFMSSLSHARHSVIAGGRHAAMVHSTFTSVEEERQYIAEVMAQLRGSFDNVLDGWRSPFGIQSPHTLQALAAAGLQYTFDLNNDDLPYDMTTDSGPLVSVPYQHFAGDLHCLQVAKQPTVDYLGDLNAGVDWLLMESKAKGTRLLTVPLHPWIMGVPHRFAQLRKTMELWAQQPGLRFVGTREIVHAK